MEGDDQFFMNAFTHSANPGNTQLKACEILSVEKRQFASFLYSKGWKLLNNKKQTGMYTGKLKEHIDSHNDVLKKEKEAEENQDGLQEEIATFLEMLQSTVNQRTKEISQHLEIIKEQVAKQTKLQEDYAKFTQDCMLQNFNFPSLE